MRTHGTTVKELADILAQKGLITEEQGTLITVKAEAQRARLQHQQAKGVGNRTVGTVSPAEIIASMELQKGGVESADPLDEDTIVKALAAGVGVGYIKIDPLKLNAALITSTVSLPFARRRKAAQRPPATWPKPFSQKQGCRAA